MARSLTTVPATDQDVGGAVGGRAAFSGEQEPIAQYAERMSVRFAIGVGAAVGLIIIFANLGRNPVPMLGDRRAFGTLALVTLALATLLTASYAFILGVRAWNAHVPAGRERHWAFAVVPVGLAYTTLVAFIGALALQLVEFAFRELVLARMQGVFLAAVISGSPF